MRLSPLLLPGKQGFLDQAERELRAAGGRPVVWQVAEEDTANAIRTLFRDNNLNIQVIHTPPR